MLLALAPHSTPRGRCMQRQAGARDGERRAAVRGTRAPCQGRRAKARYRGSRKWTAVSYTEEVQATHLWVILDTPDGKLLVHQTLDRRLAAVLRVRPRGDLQLGGDSGWVDAERVVHHGIEGVRSHHGRSEQPLCRSDGHNTNDVAMRDLGRLHDLRVSFLERGEAHLATERNTDSLVTKADAEDGHRMRPYELQSESNILPSAIRTYEQPYRWVVGSSWPGGEDDTISVRDDLALERSPAVSSKGEAELTSHTCQP